MLSEENIEDNSNEKKTGKGGYKRKRPKSFLQIAKKCSRNGRFGKGSEIGADLYNYFVRIWVTYKEGFETEEEKLVFVNNVFEQTEDKEIDISANQMGCRVIEALLPFTNDDVLQRFIKAFSEELRPLCTDQYASHVLEALIIQSTDRSLEISPDRTEERTNYFKQFTIKISKYLLNNMEDFMWDHCSNPVMRICLESLAQIPKVDSKKPQKIHSCNLKNDREVPDEYSEIVRDYGERLICWPQFVQTCETTTFSCFVQVLLRALKKVDKKLLKRYLQKLLNDVFLKEDDVNSKKLPFAFRNENVMRLLESAMQVAGKKLFTQIYSKLFIGNLCELAESKECHYTVDKLFAYCEQQIEFEAMFDEIIDSVPELVKQGKSALLLAVTQGCKRFSSRQGKFIQTLLNSFECAGDDEKLQHFVLCLCRFQILESLLANSEENLQKAKLNYNGSMIVQTILEYNKPILIVNSILKMNEEQLKDLFCNSIGSYIADAFVKGPFVGEKSREKLVRKFRGFYKDLTISKFGSRSFEALWDAANTKNRLGIMEELSNKDASWCHTDHGRIIASKINYNLYKTDKEKWKNNLNNLSNNNSKKVQEMFAEVLK